MKKLITCLLLVLGITNTTFALGINDYHIQFAVPEVKDIVIKSYDTGFVTYMNNVYVSNQYVDVTYDSPITGNLIFNCRLKNSQNKNEVPITLTKFLYKGLNFISGFYSIPSYIFNPSTQTWATFFDIFIIDNVSVSY